MSISVKHPFVSAKSDDVDATNVRPSNWNENHTLTMATNKLLGRGTAADGPVEEITLGANLSFSGTTLNVTVAPDGDKGDIIVSGSGTTWTIDTNAVTYAKLQQTSAPSVLLGRGAASAGDPQEIVLGTGLTMSGNTLISTGGATSGFSTGDVKLTLKTVVDAGWVFMNDGSIGDATSGATSRANADTQALFVLLWDGIADTWAPVSGGRGANALADFTAHKTLGLPKALGRSLAVAGAGSGLTSRVLGSNLGAESVTPSVATMASHGHGDAGHSHGTPVGTLGLAAAALGGDYTVYAALAPSATLSSNSGLANITANGGGTPFGIIDPSTYLNVMVKL